MNSSATTNEPPEPPSAAETPPLDHAAGFSPEVRRFGKRAFILASVLSIVVSQPISGNVLTLLFRNMLHASELTIGVLVLAMNLTFVGILLGTPLAARWGNHVLITRLYLIASVLVLPLLVVRWLAQSVGPDVALAVVFVSTVLRMLVQQIGAAAWFPIMHDLVERDQRGKFLATMRTSWQFANVATIVGVGLLFGGQSEWWHFEIVFAFAVIARIFWLACVWKLPTLPPLPGHKAKGFDWDLAFECLHDRQFVLYLIYVASFSIAVAIVEPFRIVYTTEKLGLTDRFALVGTAMSSVGAIITLHYWGKLADRFGNRATFSISTVAMVFISLGWLVVDSSPFGKVMIIVLYTVAGAFVAGNGVAQTNYMLAAMEKREIQASYSAVTTTVSMLATGLASLLGGGFLKLAESTGFRWQHGTITLNSYQLLFFVSSFLFLIPHAMRRPLRVPEELPTAQVIRNMARPLRNVMGPLMFWSGVASAEEEQNGNGPRVSDEAGQSVGHANPRP